ncbi:hypothetical protein SDC9_161533 [bioreactor metagenome]|uniref:Uncharacterized protein n=1 Tax=bioreactor metagenome TaxID=1076179 RepID=A0A645FIL7_9ZZZZ
MYTAKILPGWAAAMIADTIKAHAACTFLYLLGTAADVLRQFLSPAAVFKGQPVCVHADPLRAFPAKVPRRQSLFMDAGPHEDIAVHPAFSQYFRQEAAMTEAVDIVAGTCGKAEFFKEVALPIQCLARETFSAWQIAVRLHQPAPRQAPSAFLHTAFDLLKHRWLCLLHPLIKECRCAGKHKIGILPHAIERGAEC